MSQSICLPASIPLANTNRSPPALRITSYSVPIFSAIKSCTTSDSATYTPTTSPSADAAKRYSSSISVFGAFVSLGLISLPAIVVLKRLERSAKRLDKVVVREVPGTLLSLKLSSMEIGRVAQILSSIRKRSFERSP